MSGVPVELPSVASLPVASAGGLEVMSSSCVDAVSALADVLAIAVAPDPEGSPDPFAPLPSSLDAGVPAPGSSLHPVIATTAVVTKTTRARETDREHARWRGGKPRDLSKAGTVATMRRVGFNVVGCMLVLVFAPGCGGDDGGSGDTENATGSGGETTQSEPANPSAGPTTDPAESSDGSTPMPGTSDSDDTTGIADDTGSTGAAADSSSGSAACEGMSFFATSTGSGALGGNLGGLRGADAICQTHAEAAGQGGCTWHAYLSTADEDARDRIGTGPWQNAMGEVIADDVESLHADGLSNGDPQHVLDENGVEVPGDEHDILTGSNEDGTVLEGSTCADWTSDSEDDVARVGHSDIPDNPMFSPSWNSAHDTPGCREQDLDQTGGAGRLYCFAID